MKWTSHNDEKHDETFENLSEITLNGKLGLLIITLW